MTGPSNEEIVLAAAAELGAADSAIDVEDIAVAADRLAPGRFRWRKYTAHINIQTIGKALRDAKQRGLFRGSSALGWRLTEAGVCAAAAAAPASSTPPRAPISLQDRRWAAKERVRLKSEAAYAKALAGATAAITPREALRFFRLDEYVVGDARETRVERIRRLFENDDDLGPVVDAIARKVLP